MTKHFVLLAAAATSLERHLPTVEKLRARGHDIQIAALDGEVQRAGFHRLGSSNGGRNKGAGLPVVSSLGVVLVRAIRPFTSHRVRTHLASRLDPWLRNAITKAHVVLLLDDEILPVRALAERWNPGAQVHVGAVAARALEEQRYWDVLDGALAEATRDGSPSGKAVSAVVEAIQNAASRIIDPPVLPAPDLSRRLLSFARGLIARGRGEELWAALVAAGELPGVDPMPSGLAAMRLAVDLSVNGRKPTDVTEAVAGALAAADEALAGGQIDHALNLVTTALGLVFHRDLHADEHQTPLVDAPASFLAPLRGRTVDALRTPLPAARKVRRGGRTHRHIVVLPGSFGRFAWPVIDALEGQPATTVEVLDLAEEHGAYRGLGVGRAIIELRLRQALGETEIDRGPVDVLDRADVVFVDWADRGAVWASLFVPVGVRLVIRVHSIDALSVWIHLIDWSRVDDIIFVGHHVEEFVLEMLGQRVAHARSHVVPNIVDVSTPIGAARPEAARTLAMVGWGQRVKDPLWALEVLRILLRHDPDWRLLFIGADFAPERSVTSRAYASEFRRQVRADDVRHHVEFVGQTADVPHHLQRAGFILSTSVREAFHLAVVEGVASGAVPVVRNWPMLAGRGGAHSVYPSDWVVETPERAADRILGSLSHRTEVVRKAQEEIRARFDPHCTRAELIRIIRGSYAR